MRPPAFVAGMAGPLAAPRAGFAQAARRKRRIGFLHPRMIDPDSPALSLLRPAWQGRGYVEGETVLLCSAAGP